VEVDREIKGEFRNYSGGWFLCVGIETGFATRDRCERRVGVERGELGGRDGVCTHGTTGVFVIILSAAGSGLLSIWNA
jgi:hypothetical protein